MNLLLLLEPFPEVLGVNVLDAKVLFANLDFVFNKSLRKQLHLTIMLAIMIDCHQLCVLIIFLVHFKIIID